MTRLLLAAFALTALAFPVTATRAQDISGAQRAACKADYEHYCKGTIPGGGRIIACLSKHTTSLSAACKKVVANAKK